MSTLSGSNSDEDQDAGQSLSNPKRRRLQFQRPNHSCNESTEMNLQKTLTLLITLIYQHRCKLFVVKQYADTALECVVAELVTEAVTDEVACLRWSIS